MGRFGFGCGLRRRGRSRSPLKIPKSPNGSRLNGVSTAGLNLSPTRRSLEVCTVFESTERQEVPDPASRFQPHDVHGPSEVIDPQGFDWKDDAWRGRSWQEAVIYELHVGAFARPGTFSAVQKRLDYLADLGVTAIELMPVSDFPGGRNWGYDGVFPFAPDSTYGRPEDLERAGAGRSPARNDGSAGCCL